MYISHYHGFEAYLAPEWQHVNHGDMPSEIEIKYVKRAHKGYCLSSMIEIVKEVETRTPSMVIVCCLSYKNVRYLQ